MIKNPERWITWLVGRRRTQQTARHCVKCRSHEHRHVERTLLARNPGVSGHVHPRVGIDSNINQYELGSTLSRAALHPTQSVCAAATRVGRQFCQPSRARLAWEFFAGCSLSPEGGGSRRRLLKYFGHANETFRVVCVRKEKTCARLTPRVCMCEPR